MNSEAIKADEVPEFPFHDEGSLHTHPACSEDHLQVFASWTSARDRDHRRRLASHLVTDLTKGRHVPLVLFLLLHARTI
jgi:hypothetical protein